jgi:hypothetical protein
LKKGGDFILHIASNLADGDMECVISREKKKLRFIFIKGAEEGLY